MNTARVIAVHQAAFDIEAAAAYVGMSTDVVRRAHRAGDLPAYYPTTKPMFKLSDLDAWIEAWPTEKPRKAG